MIVRVPPSRQYLGKVGELAYLVSDLEWETIDDICLAAKVDVVKLLGKTTGAIGPTLELVADVKHRPNVHRFVSTSGKARLDAAARRNACLHARPGTSASEDEQLLRLREGRTSTPNGSGSMRPTLIGRSPRPTTGSGVWEAREGLVCIRSISRRIWVLHSADCGHQTSRSLCDIGRPEGATCPCREGGALCRSA